jgi:hypothetical protein
MPFQDGEPCISEGLYLGNFGTQGNHADAGPWEGGADGNRVVH